MSKENTFKQAVSLLESQRGDSVIITLEPQTIFDKKIDMHIPEIISAYFNTLEDFRYCGTVVEDAYELGSFRTLLDYAGVEIDDLLGDAQEQERVFDYLSLDVFDTLFGAALIRYFKRENIIGQFDIYVGQFSDDTDSCPLRVEVIFRKTIDGKRCIFRAVHEADI